MKLQDTFSPNLNFVLEEANGAVDGISVLARVRGAGFFPGGTSQNKRYYSAKVWEKVLKDAEIQEKLKEKY
jgi:tripartite-type tricarboxylate transporter receptor subunit TctC